MRQLLTSVALAATLTACHAQPPLDDNNAEQQVDVSGVDVQSSPDIEMDVAANQDTPEDTSKDAAAIDAQQPPVDTATLQDAGGQAVVDSAASQDGVDGNGGDDLGAQDDASLVADVQDAVSTQDIVESDQAADAVDGDEVGVDIADATESDVADAVGPPPPCTQDKDCDTGEPCRIPKCLASGKCTSDIAANETSCVPANKCRINAVCYNGWCLSNLKKCFGAKVCHTVACDPKTGECAQTPKKPGGWCSDGNACTSSDKCQPDGTCKGKLKSDGSSCKGKTPCKLHHCKSGACWPYKTKSCNDHNQCTIDSCDPKYNDCYHKQRPTGAPCDDGIACTHQDACKWGYCWGQEVLKGCSGLPLDACGDLVCADKETASGCPVDCHYKVNKTWMLFWAGCKKDVLKCLNDKGCLKTAGCRGLCKYSDHIKDKIGCMKACIASVSSNSNKLYDAVQTCAHTLG